MGDPLAKLIAADGVALVAICWLQLQQLIGAALGVAVEPLHAANQPGKGL